MAKRFTDSEKFRDNWYRKLSPKHKCLWEFMLSECSISGILEIDFDSMSFHIGEKINQSDLDLFSDKFHWVEEDKIFIPNFIKFQQRELSESNKAHRNIINTLEKYNIPVSLDMSQYQSPIEGASKGLQSPISIGIGKGNSIGNIYKLNNDEDMEKAVSEYNEVAKKLNLPVCQKLSSARKSKLAARLKDAGGIDGWVCALNNLENSRFCRGENERGWKADIDFLLQEKSFLKLMEGSYNHEKFTKSERVKAGLQEWVDGR